MPLPPGDNRVPPPPKRTDSSQQAAGHEREMRRQQRPVANSTGAPPRVTSGMGYGAVSETTALDGFGSGSVTVTLGSDAKAGFGTYFLTFSGASGAAVGFVNFGSTGPVGVSLDAAGNGLLPIPWPTTPSETTTIGGYADGATGGTFSVTAYYPNR